MTELDIEMALLDIGRAADSLHNAARDKHARGYVEANRTWLLDEVNRLSEILVKVEAKGSRQTVRRRVGDQIREASRAVAADRAGCFGR
jgi:hypothetical protein